MLDTFTGIFLLALAASTAVQVWLCTRHMRHVAAHRERVPAQFEGRIGLDAHRKAAGYTVARTRLGLLDIGLSVVLLLGWTLGGGIAAMQALWAGSGLGEPWTGAAVVMSVVLVGSLLSLPVDALATFGVEQRFGFNRTSLSTFVSDVVKKLALTVLIGTPLTALVLWLMQSLGPLWWLAAWLVWLGVNLLAVWAFPVLIAPLFNRFEPLQDQNLVERIQRLLQRHGLSASGVFVADGSRRSGHGNAYFTGLGASKRIVFYDTLLNSLDADEVEAVLAHEVGHFKRHHIPKQLGMSAAVVMAALALLGWLAGEPWFYAGLGVEQPDMAAALLLFVMVAPVFFFFLSPLTSALSRKHEFEADAFAADTCDGGSLVRALVKLYRSNASTLTPDPLYSAFHDSHPPAPLRVARLEAELAARGAAGHA